MLTNYWNVVRLLAQEQVVTRFEQIAIAFPLHCQRIAECVHDSTSGYEDFFDRFMNEPSSVPNVHAVLSGAFVWANTTEGHEYWAALAGVA